MLIHCPAFSLLSTTAPYKIPALAQEEICVSSPILWKTFPSTEAASAPRKAPHRYTSCGVYVRHFSLTIYFPETITTACEIISIIGCFVLLDQRDYICEFCARAFKSSHNLAVHRMIHTGEKPLQSVPPSLQWFSRVTSASV